MSIIDLSVVDAEETLEMQEISGAPATVQTICSFKRLDGAVQVRIDAYDDRMLDLVATVPKPGIEDQFLFEEDCIQVAAASAGTAEATEFLLVNPYGSSRAFGEAKKWDRSVCRHEGGWRITIIIPVLDAWCVWGLSVHRFYRGVHHEVLGISTSLPHPLDTSVFPLFVLKPVPDAEAAANGYRSSTRGAQNSVRHNALAAFKARIDNRTKPTIPWTQLAAEFAERRAAEEVRSATGFLCWNEGHYQHALIDLWQLTGEIRWLEMAVERMDQVWSVTGEQIGLEDTIWGEKMPTWYDHNDELGTAICLITGVILYPIARLMHTVHNSESAVSLRPGIEPWVERCRRAVAVHDREWVELPDGSGIYLEPHPKGPNRIYPNVGSRVAPLNRAFLLAMPLLYLARVLKDEIYLDRVERMARFFRHSTEILENGTMVWEYEASRYPATGEDISHGHCQLLFAEHCCSEGIEFTENDLRKIAATLEKNIFRYGDVPCEEIRGIKPTLNLAAGAWSGLCRFVPNVFEKIEAVLETYLSENPNQAEPEGWLIRILTMVDLSRRQLGENHSGSL